jgi:hypothetical protein
VTVQVGVFHRQIAAWGYESTVTLQLEQDVVA